MEVRTHGPRQTSVELEHKGDQGVDVDPARFAAPSTRLATSENHSISGWDGS
jgi:hypothetical protein